MTLAAPPVPAYRPFAAEVARVRRLSPSFLRVTFTGPSFDDLAPNGWDQRIKVLLPHAEHGLRNCPRGGDWYAAWRALPQERRNPIRTYTVRASRPELREIDVDFVLHGPTGPASAWAESATAGAEVVLIGPNARFPGSTGGFEWRPPAAAPCLLVAGDETAVPAVCAIVESLPAGGAARVLLEVPGADDTLPLAVPAGVDMTWLPRQPARARHGALLTAAVVSAVREIAGGRTGGSVPEPGDSPSGPGDDAPAPEEALWEVPEQAPGSSLYAWLAGEAGVVTGLRRELVRLGLDPRSVAFMGYWRAGRSGG
jgi:NADPH-dependent ferric siderophore reductase